MKKKTAVINEEFKIMPIGHIRGPKSNPRLEILQEYRPALKQLEHFSHVIVIWWAHRRDNRRSRAIMQTRPPYAKKTVTGIFATRAPYRPNPIALTTCRILKVDLKKGVVRISSIDAGTGTPVVDLKAYFPCCDRVKNAHIPNWLKGWHDWMPE